MKREFCTFLFEQGFFLRDFTEGVHLDFSSPQFPIKSNECIKPRNYLLRNTIWIVKKSLTGFYCFVSVALKNL